MSIIRITNKDGIITEAFRENTRGLNRWIRPDYFYPFCGHFVKDTD